MFLVSCSPGLQKYSKTQILWNIIKVINLKPLFSIFIYSCDGKAEFSDPLEK